MNRQTHTAVTALLLLASTVAYCQSNDRSHIVTRIYTSLTTYNDVIQYYDGLGRPVQTVRKQFTPGGKDLVSRTEYDEFGREWKNSLPVPNDNSNGAFDNTTAAASFYGDAAPYSETGYEPSPLNRILEQYGPGSVWRNNSRRVKTEYLANTSSGDLVCPYYFIHDPWTLKKNGNYAAGQLYVTKTTDEDNNLFYEFRDKIGRVLLQRRMVGAVKYDINYVYDDFGNLVRVLPPIVSDGLTADNTAFSTWGAGTANELLTNYGYWYYYDSKNRKIGTFLARCFTDFVYDKADRVVFIQTPNVTDANASRNWVFNKYDELGRLIMTGRYHGDEESEDHENVRAVNMHNRWQNQISKETRSDSKKYGYTWTSFPDSSSVTVTRINYYDDYYYYATNNDWHFYHQEKTGYGTPHTTARGLLTGTRSRLLTGEANAEQWITTVYYYDYRGNVVQKRSNNQLGGYDYEYYAYNYNNQVTKKYIEHNTSSQPTVLEEYVYSYDPQLRLTGVTHSLNGGTPVSIAGYAYNDLGQVQTETTGGLETTVYTYNIRGWEESQTGNNFEEKLYYTANPQSGGQVYFGGNISALTWKNPASGSTARGYAFQYDALGMLKDAAYGEGASLSANTQRYSESFTWDKHGNPLSVKRYGRKDNGAYGLIDDLSISASSYVGNWIREVNDAAGDQNAGDLMEFKNGIDNPWEEYIYNSSGALTADYNRKICQIRYNYLLLPQSVQFRYGHRIEYVYDAAGVKRTVTYRESNRDMNYFPWDGRVPSEGDFLPYSQTRDYTGNKVYENGQLKLILTENGYITKDGNTYSRHYYLTDHLGNNRVVLNASGTPVQQTNYYPSGTVMAENPARPGRTRAFSPTSSGEKSWTGRKDWISTITMRGSMTRR